MTEERKVQLVATVDTTQTRDGFNEIRRDAGEMASSVARSGDQAARAVGGIGAGAGRSAGQVESAQRNLIGSIQRTTAAMEAGSRSSSNYYEVLARQRGVDRAAIDPYLAQLRAVESAQARSNVSLNAAVPAFDRLGVSAAQTAAAMRGVPAQFTDIVTSLQGGQNPLTVLIQQGGQLSDMFGGTGNAARALATYVRGLITPYTLAGAAAATFGVTLAVAYNQGSKEADAFTRSLALSGNAVGATTSQLAGMAKEIGWVVGTQGDAAEAVAAMAATGRVAFADMQRFSELAVTAQRTLGQSVGDTASEFAELGQAPLATLEKLNEKYRFLTGAVYAQVKALEDQGRTDEAAAVAQRAYAAAVDERMAKVIASLGPVQKAWKGVKDFAGEAWDAMLNVGRADTLAEKLASVQAQIKKAQGPFDAGAGGNAEARMRLASNLEMEKSLKGQIQSETAAAKAGADRVKLNEAQVGWLKEGEKYLSRGAMMEREIGAARNQGTEAQKSQVEIEQRIGEIRKKYTESYTGGVDAQIEAIKRRAEKEDVLGKRSLEQLSANRAAGLLTEEDYITRVGTLESTGFDRARVAAEQELAITKTKKNSLREQAELIGQIAVIKEQKVSREIQTANELFALEQKRFALAAENYAKVIDGAANDRDKLIGQLRAQEDYNQGIGLTRKQVAELDATRLEANATLAEENALIAEGVDLTGRLSEKYQQQADALRARAAAMRDGAEKEVVHKAHEDMLAEGKRMVDQYSDVFRTGFADMLNKGKDGWQSFTKSLVTTFKTSVADQIYKMFAQPFVVKMVASLLGVTGGATVSGAAQAATGAGQGASLVNTASSAYSMLSGGMTVAGGLGTGFAGSISGGLMGAGAGSGLTSAAGLAIGEGIAGVVGPAAASAIGSGMTAVAAAMPWLAAAAVAGVLLKKAFGHGDRETTGTNLTGSFGPAGFMGSTNESWKEAGGWLSSDRTGVKTTALDATAAKSLTSAYDQIKKASADFALTLGINADAIAGRAQSLNIALTTDKAANEKAVADFFIGVGDTIAKELLPNIADFASAGEAASSTLQRLAGNFQATDQFASMLGKSAAEMFGAAGIASATARERLLDLSGGAAGLGQKTTSYMQAFYSEAAKIAPVIQAVDGALAALGLSSVKTKEDFKAQIDGMLSAGALATASGATLFASLMDLAPAFAQVADAADGARKAKRALEIDIMTLQGDAAGALAARREDELAAMDAGLRPLQARKYALEDEAAALALNSAVLDLQGQMYAAAGDKAGAAAVLQQQHAAALAGLSPALAAATQALWGAQAAASAIAAIKTDAADQLGNVDAAFAVLGRVIKSNTDLLTPRIAKEKALSEALHSTLDSMRAQVSGQEELDRRRAQAQIKAALATTKAGGALPAADDLKKALGIVSKDASAQFSTLQDYLRDLYTTQNDIAALSDITDAALSVDEKSLKTLEDMLASAQTQVDLLKGIDTTGLTIAGAMAGLQLAIAGAMQNPMVAATAGINSAYQSALGRAPDKAGLEFWQGQAAGGASTADITSLISGSAEAQLQAMYKQLLGRPADAAGLNYWLKSGASMSQISGDIKQSDEYAEYKKLRGFAVGTNYLPQTMPILAHEGERIIPAADNRALMAHLSNPAANNAVLTAAVERLTREVEGLRAEARATAGHTEKAARLLDGAIQDNAFVTREELA